jgi:hypothetical protein
MSQRMTKSGGRAKKRLAHECWLVSEPNFLLYHKFSNLSSVFVKKYCTNFYPKINASLCNLPIAILLVMCYNYNTKRKRGKWNVYWNFIAYMRFSLWSPCMDFNYWLSNLCNYWYLLDFYNNFIKTYWQITNSVL